MLMTRVKQRIIGSGVAGGGVLFPHPGIYPNITSRWTSRQMPPISYLLSLTWGHFIIMLVGPSADTKSTLHVSAVPFIKFGI